MARSQKNVRRYGNAASYIRFDGSYDNAVLVCPQAIGGLVANTGPSNDLVAPEARYGAYAALNSQLLKSRIEFTYNAALH